VKRFVNRQIEGSKSIGLPEVRPLHKSTHGDAKLGARCHQRGRGENSAAERKHSAAARRPPAPEPWQRREGSAHQPPLRQLAGALDLPALWPSHKPAEDVIADPAQAAARQRLHALDRHSANHANEREQRGGARGNDGGGGGRNALATDVLDRIGAACRGPGWRLAAPSMCIPPVDTRRVTRASPRTLTSHQ
jgi:hypothetical protein